MTTFGADQHRVPLAAAAALLAVPLVVAGGFVARAPLARLPENTMKFAVGVLLCSYGVFWSTEGAGAHWPGGDAATRPCPRVRADGRDDGGNPASPFRRGPGNVTRVRCHGAGVWELLVGDNPWAAAGVAVSIGLTAVLAGLGVPAWWVMPIAVLAVLGVSLRRTS